MKAKRMTDSLTPWDYEPDPHDRPRSPKRLPLPLRQQSISRFNSEGRLRVRTSQKTRGGSRDVIKLQERVPTESFAVPDWQVEIKALGFLRNELVIKIPNQFVTLPPKRSVDSKKPVKSVSRQAEPAVREKVSFRNFKKEIEELDRLRTANKSRFGLGNAVNAGAARGVMKLSETSHACSSIALKRCSLQNMNPFEEAATVNTEKDSAVKLRVREARKKHVLDELLSKFQ